MKPSELIADPSKWCRGDWARDALGNNVGHDSPLAVCWCAVGAIRKCVGYSYHLLAQAIAASAPLCHRPGDPLATCIRYNDSHSHEDVLARLKEAGL